MENTPVQVIPCLVPANRHPTFDFAASWLVLSKHSFLSHTAIGAIPFAGVSCGVSLTNRGHYASSEEVFTVTLTKLGTGHSNVVFADIFGLSGDGMVTLI